MTRDGAQVLLARLGEWNQVLGHLYLRPLGGGPAVDFGEGGTLHKLPTLSPDGRFIAYAIQSTSGATWRIKGLTFGFDMAGGF